MDAKKKQRRDSSSSSSANRRKQTAQPSTDYPGLDDEAEHIVEHLDMATKGPYRGDEILHAHGQSDRELEREDTDPVPVDDLLGRFRFDMSEPDREGDEMSGDDHSLGLQGGEHQEKQQAHIDSDIPGEETEDQEARTQRIERRRAV